MRMILNFPLKMPSPGPLAVNDFAAREQPFRLGAASRGEGERERWGWALLLTALVHAGLGWALSQPAAPRPAAMPPAEPELVFMHLAPPPPPAAGATASRAERVKSRPRVPALRPAMPRPLPPEPVAEPTPEPEPVAEEAPTPEEPTLESVGVADTVAGVMGGVLGGREGGLVGGTGDALDVKQVAQAPRVLHQIWPRYPRTAMNDGVEGLVLVRVIIGVDGRVEPGSLQIVRSVDAFDAVVLSAVGQWRFSPAVGHQGRPVRVIVEIPFQFALK